jgi:hypothetical protein
MKGMQTELSVAKYYAMIAILTYPTRERERMPIVEINIWHKLHCIDQNYETELLACVEGARLRDLYQADYPGEEVYFTTTILDEKERDDD